MKRIWTKSLKIAGILLGSLLLLLAAAVGIVSRMIVTPEKLTPIVEREAARFLRCEYHIGEVDLTLFSTFPAAGVRIRNLLLLNPMEGSPSDTLANIKECVLSLNIRELIKNSHYIIHQLRIDEADAHLFVNANGESNFNVFISDSANDEKGFTIDHVDLRKLDLKKIDLSYTDLENHVLLEVGNLNTTLQGKLEEETLDGKARLKMESLLFSAAESSPTTVQSGPLTMEMAGTMTRWDEWDGRIALESSKLFVRKGDTVYADDLKASLDAPLRLSLEKRLFSTPLTEITVQDYLLKIKGEAEYKENKDMAMDLSLESNPWDIEKLLSLVPADFRELLDTFKLRGSIALTGTLQGIYNDTLIPSLSVGLKWHEGAFSYPDPPYCFHQIESELRLALAEDGKTHLMIQKLNARTGNSRFSVAGSVMDLMEEQKVDLQVRGTLNLPELRPVLPEGMAASGQMEFDAQALFTLAEIQNLELGKVKAGGMVTLKDLEANYQDSLLIQSDLATLHFSMPPRQPVEGHLLSVQMEAGSLAIAAQEKIKADLQGTVLEASLSDFLDTNKLPSIDCAFAFEKLALEMDTLSIQSRHPQGTVELKPSAWNPRNPEIRFTFKNDQLQVKNGGEMEGRAEEMALSGHARYDETKEDLILQWNPELKVSLSRALLHTAALALPVEIPEMDFHFTPGKFDIQKSEVILGNSHLNLSGLVNHWDRYLNGTGLLTGNLDLSSDYVDVDQLMGLFNAFNSEVDSAEKVEMENGSDKPFMVPRGIDITLKTGVDKALFNGTELSRLAGQLRLKDGILVLEEMGFTSEAAVMQLTAIYRTPRANHLFVGLDFHLLDVNIEKLLEMMPFVDQTLPMLHSFAGHAEFHFAIETYLKSNYEIKYSTLRGALAVSGDSLVLLDGKNFSEISKMLKFSKKTENLVDSLSVELTIFKNEIDIYPFEIAIDKYKAVLSGRHNFNFMKDALGHDTLDMNFKYHVSITDTPLPVRLGLNITGNFSDLKFKLAPCQYAHLFRPKRQGTTDQEILRLKRMISDALEANVKPGLLSE